MLFCVYFASCEKSNFRHPRVAQTHSYGISHSIERLAEARAAARLAEAAEAVTAQGGGSGAAATAAWKRRPQAPPHPRLFKMSALTGVHTNIPWGSVSLGKDNCVAQLNHPACEGFAAAFFYNPVKVKAEQGPITDGWIGLGPSATKFSMMGMMPDIMRPEPDKMSMWDGFNADKMSEEDESE